MTGYCTKDDLTRRFGTGAIAELIDRNLDGTADDGALTSAIADAGAVIDTYLSRRNPAFPAPPHRALTAIACDLVWAALHINDPPEAVTKRHDAALRMLRDMTGGRAASGAAGKAGVAAAIAPAAGDIAISATPPVFGDGGLQGF